MSKEELVEVSIEVDEDVPEYIKARLHRPTADEISAKQQEDFFAFKTASAPQLLKQKTAMEELISIGLSEETARLLTCYYEHDEQFVAAFEETMSAQASIESLNE